MRKTGILKIEDAAAGERKRETIFVAVLFGGARRGLNERGGLPVVFLLN